MHFCANTNRCLRKQSSHGQQYFRLSHSGMSISSPRGISVSPRSLPEPDCIPQPSSSSLGGALPGSLPCAALVFIWAFRLPSPCSPGAPSQGLATWADAIPSAATGTNVSATPVSTDSSAGVKVSAAPLQPLPKGLVPAVGLRCPPLLQVLPYTQHPLNLCKQSASSYW